MKNILGIWIRHLDLLVLAKLEMVETGILLNQLEPSILDRLVDNGLAEAPAWSGYRLNRPRAFITEVGRRILGAQR